MAPSAQAHQRSHSLLLLQKLLNLRDSASPLTLILDSLEQSAGPLIQEFTTRAKLGRSTVVFISFATVRRPQNADIFIKARGKSLKALAAEIASHCPMPRGVMNPKELVNSQKYLVIIDTLNPLVSSGENTPLLPAFFSEIISPVASLVAVYHEDVPITRTRSEYDPHPLTLLSHLATAVFRVSSLYEAVEAKRAQSRSLPEPEFGLREGREGVLIGLKKGLPASSQDGPTGGVVVEMEMRRRSGRSVAEKFVLLPSSGVTAARKTGAAAVGALGSNIMLLSDHPLFAPPPKEAGASGEAGQGEGEGEMADTTFNLGLTEKQRKDREGIVLPYFDAQTDIGAGEGGRILYEMGREDDWDDEEDEI
ncbi:Elongator complex protein 5 [Naviculisporaceae sp. PSN 640]